MNQPKISIIVPIYNVESYLVRCVESLLAQTETQLEIILVDDGSSDGCPAMCDAYAAKDARIRVIHKENGGLPSARNAGIAVATAPFIAFVDADDYVQNDMYACLLQAQQRTGAPLVCCGFRRVYADHTVDEAFAEEKVLCGEDLRRFAKGLFMGDIFGAVWRILYARSIIGDTTFDLQARYAEDLLFNLEVLKKAPSVALLKDVLYLYEQDNTNSITNRTAKDPDFRYRYTLQKKLALNEYWQFEPDLNAFYKIYVDMMYLFLVRELQTGNKETVEKFLADDFFISCCAYDAYIPLRRRIVGRLILKKRFRTALLLRRAQDALMKLLGRTPV